MRTAEAEKQRKIGSDRKQIMRHLAGWLLGCAAFLLMVFPVYAEGKFNVTSVTGSGTITTETLNVRSGPGKEYDAIELVRSGEVVTITGQADNGWYQIDLDGKTGYVSDKYVSLNEDAAVPDGADGDEGQTEEEIGEPEEGWAFYQNPRFIKTAVIVVIIFVVFVMLVTTFKGIRGDRDPDEDEDEDEDFDEDLTDDEDDEDNDDEDNDDEDDDDDDDEDDDDEDDDDAEDEDDDDDDQTLKDIRPARKKSRKSKTVVIREEDYQLHIDPKYFENTTQIEQPAMVTGYLERKKLEEELEAASAEGRQKELEQAMQKLNELQAEIERLKKNQ